MYSPNTPLLGADSDKYTFFTFNFGVQISDQASNLKLISAFVRLFLHHVILHMPYFVTGFNPRKKQLLALSYTVAKKNTHFRSFK
jgi:hypothetical protein